MPYSENQLLERLGKIRDEVTDSVAKIHEDVQRNNELINTNVMTNFADNILTIELSAIRTNIMFAKNILAEMGRLIDYEEQRRRYTMELEALRKKQDVKNQRKRARQQDIEENPYPKVGRNSLI